MYTATMHFKFKDGQLEEGCDIWRREVLDKAKNQPGCVRMQFLTDRDSGAALAMGSWESPEHAQAFMETGVFSRLLNHLQPLLAESPVPQIWNLMYYLEEEK